MPPHVLKHGTTCPPPPILPGGQLPTRSGLPELSSAGAPPLSGACGCLQADCPAIATRILRVQQ